MAFQDVVAAMVNLAPYHLISYSFILGTGLFQSFVAVKAAHKTLPRPAFVTLQGHLFPVYFRLQTVGLFLTAATYPPHGPVSLVKDRVSAILISVGALGALL